MIKVKIGSNEGKYLFWSGVFERVLQEIDGWFFFSVKILYCINLLIIGICKMWIMFGNFFMILFVVCCYFIQD